ncbi:hypothetical protein RND81_02G203500 [Saponaria officinalis]|uniref:NADH dehydrogenase subunit 6 n=1 Tax=Saponaria officinalis TaxID=3572 RepID=A0AAW1MYE3_SAPOF
MMNFISSQICAVFFVFVTFCAVFFVSVTFSGFSSIAGFYRDIFWFSSIATLLVFYCLFLLKFYCFYFFSNFTVFLLVTVLLVVLCFVCADLWMLLQILKL